MNFCISLLGWFLWNWAEFSIDKEKDEATGKTISFIQYAKSHFKTWIGSFFCILLLLWAGWRQINLDPFEVVIGAKLGWNDLYLLSSGFVWDAIIFLFKKAKKYFVKKEQE